MQQAHLRWARTLCGPLRTVDVVLACRRRGGRATAAPPFSVPRSRGTVANCNAQPRQHSFARLALRTSRIGPAPGGTTAALLHPQVACHAVPCHPGVGAGGLGYGRRNHSRCPPPEQENTVLMARGSWAESGAPRAWAGERTPGRLPRCSTSARSQQRRSATGRTPPPAPRPMQFGSSCLGSLDLQAPGVQQRLGVAVRLLQALEDQVARGQVGR